MKELTCFACGHEFNREDTKHRFQDSYICPVCCPTGFGPHSHIQSEYGGSVRCRTSDGRIVNMADEMNRLEKEKEK